MEMISMQCKKTKKKGNCGLLLSVLLSMISFLYSAIAKATWFNSSCNSDFHFGLMAIAALFGGFLYTNYSLLVDIVEHPKVAELNLTSVIERRNQRICNGVISAVFSALASLCLVLFSQPSFIHGHSLIKSIIPNWKYYVYLYIQNAEVVFLICMVFFFIKSFKDMDKLLQIIRKPSSKIDDQKLTNIKESIKK